MPIACDNTDEDKQQQQDELSALEAIYGGDCVIAADHTTCQVFVPDLSHEPHVCLRVHLPPAYPSSAPPIPEIHGPHLSNDVRAWIVRELESQFTPGEVVLYTWTEWLKEQQHLWAPAPEIEHLPSVLVDSDAELAAQLQQADLDAHQKAGASQQPPGEQGMNEDLIIHGEPFTEHKSTFQAHLAPVTSPEDVEKCMTTLLQHNKIRNATHNILAYRIYVKDRDAWLQDSLQDYDDDGEDAAGGRLLHLLQILDVKDTIVVVTRWYGGVELGPARFTHINNAARILLEKCGQLNSESSHATDSKKKKGKRH